MVEPSPSGWGWFTATPIPPDDLAASFARCFASPDGTRVLGHLRALTLDRALSPTVSDAALRHQEGQRALVAAMLALVARGRGRGEPPFSP